MQLVIINPEETEKMVICCNPFCLRAGTLIIGWLSLMGEVSDLTISALKLDQFNEEVPTDKYNEPTKFYETKGFMIVRIIGAATGVLFCILFLHGTYNKKPSFMIPYLMVITTGIIVGFFTWLTFVVFSFMNTFVQGMTVLGFGLLILGIISCYYTIIYAYYDHLTRNLGTSSERQSLLHTGGNRK